MEMVGLKIDKVFVTSWLKKHEVEEIKFDSNVAAYFKDRTAFIKEKAIA